MLLSPSYVALVVVDAIDDLDTVIDQLNPFGYAFDGTALIDVGDVVAAVVAVAAVAVVFDDALTEYQTPRHRMMAYGRSKLN